jgi:hypothetical protein
MADCTSIEGAFKKAHESNFPFKCLLILHGCFDLPVIQTRTNRNRGDYYGTPAVQSESIGLSYVSDPNNGFSIRKMIVDTGADLVTVFNHRDMNLNEDCFRYAIVANHIGFNEISLSFVIDGYLVYLMGNMTVEYDNTGKEFYSLQEYEKRECLVATDLNIHILWHLYQRQAETSKEQLSSDAALPQVHPFLSFENKANMHNEFLKWTNQQEWSRPQSLELIEHLRQNGVRTFYSKYPARGGYDGFSGLIGMNYLRHVTMQKPANQLNFVFADDI